MENLRVSKVTNVRSLAGAIAANIRKEGQVDVSAVGPIALNQAIKAVVSARRYLQSDDNKSDLIAIPEYHVQIIKDDTIDVDREVSSIVLHLKRCEYKEENDITVNRKNNKSILIDNIETNN